MKTAQVRLLVALVLGAVTMPVIASAAPKCDLVFTKTAPQARDLYISVSALKSLVEIRKADARARLSRALAATPNKVSAETIDSLWSLIAPLGKARVSEAKIDVMMKEYEAEPEITKIVRLIPELQELENPTSKFDSEISSTNLNRNLAVMMLTTTSSGLIKSASRDEVAAQIEIAIAMSKPDAQKIEAISKIQDISKANHDLLMLSYLPSTLVRMDGEFPNGLNPRVVETHVKAAKAELERVDRDPKLLLPVGRKLFALAMSKKGATKEALGALVAELPVDSPARSRFDRQSAEMRDLLLAGSARELNERRAQSPEDVIHLIQIEFDQRGPLQQAALNRWSERQRVHEVLERLVSRERR